MTLRPHAAATFVVAFLIGTSAADAQITPNQPASPQATATEARTVGRKGARQTSISGSLTAEEVTNFDLVYNTRGQIVGTSESTSWQTNLFLFLEQAWFVNDRMALRLGSLMSGNTDSTTTGLTGGLRLYATPRGASSLYVVGNGGFISSKFDSGDESSTTAAGLAEGGIGFESIAGTNASYFIEALGRRSFVENGGRNQFLLAVGIRIVY